MDTATQFFKKIASGGEMKKQGEDAVNSYIRLKIRENCTFEQIVTHTPITTAECNYYVDANGEASTLVKWVEIEPDSTASSLTFRGQPQSQMVKGKAVPCYFGPTESDEYVANIFEIAKYQNDLKKILNDQSIKNIAFQKDAKWFAECDRLVTLAGESQNYVIPGPFTKENWINALQHFPIKMPLGHVVMNTRTSKSIMKWNYWKDLPGDVGSNIYKGNIIVPGQDAGVKTIYTTKDELVPDGVVWLFATEDFFAKAYVLQEPTVFFKQEKNNVMFSTMTVWGGVIANSLGMVKVTFTSEA